ncbi:cytochrome P450 oxidoreductase [Sphaerosporella brunnea]|uniref:Cytochrome P450 oxidoreductase n=1 Tax=Sphaerosporella brunnea TaxID=1250544 RepID=A0A5J5F2E9_9PEZI|nr:cytochrome P450 oxidoreductase [Sphaerosporella brunnea]
MLSLSLLVLLAGVGIYNVFSFLHCLRQARRTGLPYVFSPVHELSNWAFLTNATLRWLYTDSLLTGQGWPRWARYMIKDGMYEDKGRAHRELGDVFLVVTPGGLLCYTADAGMSMNVLARRRDFIKPREKMKMIEPFGPNIVSTELPHWRRHFKITAPAVGDKVNDLVWKETTAQTTALQGAWVRNGVENLNGDVNLLALNVMGAAGFGRQMQWRASDETTLPAGHTMTLLAALNDLVRHLGVILLLPKKAIQWSPWKKGYVAHKEFEQYMQELIAEEKQGLAQNALYEGKLKGNLLTAVLRTNATEEKNEKATATGEKGTLSGTLSDTEVLGNIFMFFMAGYDTTANAMSFGSVLLALYPKIQDRIIAELDQVYAEAAAAGRSELTQAEDFPKFRYVLAYMYEALRVFPVVIPIARGTTQSQQVIADSSATFVLPAACEVVINNTAVHFHARYWPEPETFEPLRWLSEDPNAYVPSAPTAQQRREIGKKLQERGQWNPNHRRGTFLTFGEGPRACIGRRFAHAEYAAYFACLLRRHRVHLADGLAAGEVERRLRMTSGGGLVTLTPRDNVKLKLVAR